MEPTAVFILAIFFAAVCSVIGYAIGEKRESGGFGALLGFLFGPIGILITAVAADGRKKCPRCFEKVNTNAKICSSVEHL